MTSPHSLWVNGRGGRFEDHPIAEVVPFLMRTYSIRPERRAHALLGISSGGFGAMGIAIKRPEMFGVVATLSGPLNMLHDNDQGRRGDDFDPATYRKRTAYDPDMLIARFDFGLLPRRVKTCLDPVSGSGPDVIARDNPADLRPDELDIDVNYPGRDNFNFDAQGEPSARLARRRGVAVDPSRDTDGRHNLVDFEGAEWPAYRRLGMHILPPTG